jgi:biopolymer transport protein ExbD
MRKKRFIRNRQRRGAKGEVHLELNSLLDVLVILLVFLIKNYSSSEIEVNIPHNIKVPDSISKTNVEKGINIQMSKELTIWIQDEKVLELAQDTWNKDNSEQVKNKLIKVRSLIERNKMGSEKIKGFSGIVNLIMDKEIEYEHIEKLMEISTEVGFEQFKFVVIET